MAKQKTFFYKELPFLEKSETKPLNGKTWGEVIKNAGLVRAPYIIWSDDKILFFPDCENEKVSGKIITISLNLEGGGLKKAWDFIRNPINIVLLVVAVALCIIPGTQPIGISILVGMAIGAVGAIFQTDQPTDSNKPGKNKYSLSGGQNQSQADNPWPAVLGKTQIIPPYVANYYSELDDKTSGHGKSHLYALLNLGYSKLKVSNIKVGDTVIAENSEDVRNGAIASNGTLPGVSIEIRQDGTIPTLYGRGLPKKMTQIGANVKSSDGNNFVYTTPRSTKRINFGIRFNGLYRMAGDGSLQEESVSLRFYYRPAGTENWRQFSNAPVTETVFTIPAQRHTEVGKTSGSLIIPMQEVRGQIGSSVKINTNYGRVTVWIINSTTMRYGLPIVGINISCTTRQDVHVPSATTFKNKTRDVLRYEFLGVPTDEDVANNPSLQWDIMVQRTTADNREERTDASYWDYAVYDLESAIMNQTQLDDSTLLAVKIEANEITQGNLNKVSCVAQTIAPVYIAGDNPTYTSADWGNDMPTSNPASLYLKCLKGAYMRKPADDNLIDYEFLAKLWGFCESKKYYCNGVIASQENFIEILQKILATCRAEFYIKNGVYSGVIDDVQPSPVAILSPKNSSEFSMTRQFGDKISAYTCTYQNAEDSYSVVTEDVYPVDSGDIEGWVKQELSLWGIDNHEQIYKIARYMLANNELRREVYQAKISVEHFSLSKGDRVFLSHDAISVGRENGYIKAVNGLELTVDEIVQPTDPAKQYGVRITSHTNGSDNSVQLIPCEQIAIANSIIILSELPTHEIKPGDFYAFGEIEQTTEDCIIKSKTIEPSPSLAAVLTMVQYAPEVFVAESEPVPPYDPRITDTRFDMAKIYTGELGEDWRQNGTTVRDDGAVFFDFSNANFKPDVAGLYNYGAMKAFGDGIIENGTVSAIFDPQRNFSYASSDNGGRIKFESDVTLFGDWSLSFWLRGEIPIDKAQIFYFNNIENGLHIEVFAKDGKIQCYYQGFIFEVLQAPEANGSHFVINYGNDSQVFRIFKDSVLIQENVINNSFSDEGDNFEIPEDFNDEGDGFEYSEIFNDEAEFRQITFAVDREEYAYLMNDDTGGAACPFGLQIAMFRLYSFQLPTNIIHSLFEKNEANVNIPAQSRYLGSTKTAPFTGYVYDYFKWIAPTNENFIFNRYYRRTISGWELFVPSEQIS